MTNPVTVISKFFVSGVWRQPLHQFCIMFLGLLIHGGEGGRGGGGFPHLQILNLIFRFIETLDEGITI